ncbi:hypothetical protein BKA82DRAFT_4365029 [Pisolithus tinctorius]|nr:hypothetical protein BKA82DRAFT_4365029 [Pisolithus tinctorius]
MGRARTTHVSRKTAPYDLRSRCPCSKQEDHQSSYSDCQPCISMVVPLQGYDNPEDFDSPPETSSPVLEAFDALKEEDLSIPSTHPTDCATLEMQYTVPKQEDPQTLLLLQQLWSYYPSSPMMLEAESSTSAKRQEHYIPPAVPIPLSSLTDPTTGKIIVDAVSLEMHAFACSLQSYVGRYERC